MANRFGNQFQVTLEKRVTDIYAKVTFGTSGAPTLVASGSKGVLSVTRNSAGTYTFVFGVTQNGAKALDVYYKLVATSVTFDTSGTSAAPAAPGLYIKSNQVNVANTASLQIVLTNTSGTATDPASTEIGYFDFTFGDSSAF